VPKPWQYSRLIRNPRISEFGFPQKQNVRKRVYTWEARTENTGREMGSIQEE
jgi:hypothetical protein